jgi:hypothetical protein
VMILINVLSFCVAFMVSDWELNHHTVYYEKKNMTVLNIYMTKDPECIITLKGTFYLTFLP